MKIYLLDKNINIINAWRKYFSNEKNVEIINDNFKEFMDRIDVECIVSPANSFGMMGGGYDLAITNYFGNSLMEVVQKNIIKNYNGEQPIGTAMMVDIPHTNKKLIHTPTMRYPSKIKDSIVVYFAMRETLRVAKNNNIDSIVIPAFGGSCGRLDCNIIAKMMRYGFDEFDNVPDKISLEYAERIKFLIDVDNY